MEKRLKEYFGKYGEVLQTVIMRDKVTGRPRGFGFVVFANPSLLDRVLQDKHSIDGRTCSFPTLHFAEKDLPWALV
ncbi:heterogeneous nuclear ribonucleoprotein 1-like isoform X2 [Elaeis guineensis]|uniref:heterogeneous nuclear ribonucleoprotein 1-like isoform X2 n=1 Tax=Elaeis guineensis var. tenera TaxID=51953 RepID=UPI00057AFFF5